MSKAKCVQVGLTELSCEGEVEHTINLAMVIEFDSIEALQEAMDSGKIEFTRWAEQSP